MEAPKKFKLSMFGFKKKDVNAYIMDCAQKAENIKKELEEKNKALEAKVAELSEKNTVYEKERACIADALLKAKLEADNMIVEAKKETDKVRGNLDRELEELKDKIRAEKARVSEIREDAKATLEEYISRLNSIDIKAGSDDESDDNTSGDVAIW